MNLFNRLGAWDETKALRKNKIVLKSQTGSSGMLFQRKRTNPNADPTLPPTQAVHNVRRAYHPRVYVERIGNPDYM